MRAKLPVLPRPVWLLGWVSLLTDTASEAIYPLLPLFLTRVLGAGALSLGLIEGTADAASSVLKIVSGRLSDRWRRRRPLVVAGYALSSLVRPLIAVVTAWPQVLALRFIDRVGKGTRGAPRDAMLACFATPETRGRVYSFHRAMDHSGAVAGPLLASLFLLIYPEQYRLLFALTLVPGLAVIVLLMWVSETSEEDAASMNPGQPATGNDRGGGGASRHAGNDGLGGGAGFQSGHDGVSGGASLQAGLPGRFYSYVAVIFLFTLGNSTDAFLLLRLSEVGVAAVWIPILWALLHVVKVGASLLGGALADRWSRRAAISLGWIVYSGVYAGFAAFDSTAAMLTLFLVYGLYFGLTEGPERALVADLAPPALRATAFGVYSAATGIGALVASVAFGLVWQRAGHAAAFALGASLALAAASLLWLAAPGASRRAPATGAASDGRATLDRFYETDSGHQ